MSLYSTTTTVKKVFILLGIIIGGIIFLNILIGIIKSAIPKKQLPPTVSFGKLPAIPFPDQSQHSTITYTLNTISGQSPTFPDRIAVYAIQQPQPDLVALDNAKALVNKGDFQSIDPTPITDVLFQWKSILPPYKVLTYNILSHDFTLTSTYSIDQNVKLATNLGNEPTAISTAKSFLNDLNAYPTDIDETKTKTTLFSINATTGQLQPATSLSTTQIILVDFFQNDINKIPIYYQNPSHSIINSLVGGGSAIQQVVEAHFTHKTILTDKNATYPLKTFDQAWKELQKGNAYIAADANPPSTSINIHDAFLGYYIGEVPQEYLMPIVVFQGDNGFYAYVSAVSDTWIQK